MEKDTLAVPEKSRSDAGLFAEEIIAGRYCVKQRLGAGGMGETYLAEDLILNRKLVIKRLHGAHAIDDSSARQLITEAKRSTAISNPHVAQIFDVCMHRNEWLLLMEFVAGTDLGSLLTMPLAPRQFFSLALQLVEAIESTHESGILHCDIKPENIMVTPEGFVKLLDFGLARIVASAACYQKTLSLVTPRQDIGGTPGYIAPEVLRQSPPSERSDIFSLGVVLYEMAGGKAPFKGRTFADSVQLTLSARPKPLSLRARGFPEELNRILLTAMCKEPELRYATTHTLFLELQAAQQKSGQSKPQKRLQMYVAGGLLLFLCAVAALFVVRSRKPAPQPATNPAPQAVKAKLLAVIPFRLIGPANATMSAYSEGLRETITSSLAQAAPADSITVLAASEVRAHALNTAKEAHRELGADLILDGSYQQFHNSVRIVYSLIDASGHILHSASVTSSTSDPFALEDNVVKGALAMLTPGAPRSAPSSHFGTQSPAAYDAYLQAIGYLRDSDVSDNLGKAVNSFAEAVRRDPDFADAYAGLGEAHWALYKRTADAAQIPLALASCSQGLKLNPEVAEVQICQGTIDAGTGRVAQARQEFQRAQQLDPQSDKALDGLALTFEKSAQPMEAERVYRQAIAARPNNWASYFALANFLLRRADYSQAASLLESAVRQFPANSFLARRLAVVYFLQGRFAQAQALLERVLAQQPHAEAYMDLGQVYLHQQRFALAVSAFEQAARMQPNDFALLADLADAYASNHQHDQAIRNYQKALDLSQASLKVNPLDLDALMVAAYSAAAVGEKQASLGYLRDALQHAPEDAEVAYYAARVHARLGDRQAAAQWIGQAISNGYSKADIATAPDLAALAR